ncbi:MAG: hypothetical protein NW241_09275 [Bacteroidia bacterium]|nr:hypothetical protein [Bacteroidia bacterium]
MQQLVSSSPRMHMQRKAAQAATGRPVVQRVGDPVELGQDQGEDITPIGTRPVAHLTMGQALVAHLGQLILFSDEFSSCSPVVMFNEDTLRGGLMHFPAGGLKGQRENLLRMCGQIVPTQIILFKRPNVMAASGYNLAMAQPDDARSIAEFLEDEGVSSDITISNLASSQYYVTLGEDDKSLLFSVAIPHSNERRSLSIMHDQTPEKEAQIKAQWANAPAAVKIGRDDWHDD